MRDYQKMSSASFKPAKPIENPEVAQLLDWCLGLGGETGEVLDHVKHAVYHGEGGDAVLITPGFLMETAKELGDVLWYVSAICTTLNISLEDVAKLNELKLQHRYTQGYSNAASADRHQREMALTSLPAYKILQSRIEGDDDAPVNIIVVGPDGAGKTTLIKRLSEVLDMPTVKCDYRTEDKLAETLKRLNTQINVIYDRFFIPDDIVYSAVKHQSHQDYAEAFNLLNQCNPVIIYVTAPLDTLYERSAAWADDYVKKEELSKIIEEYGNFFDYFEGPVFRVNNTDPVDSSDYEEMIQSIVSFVTSCQALYSRYPSYEEFHIYTEEDYEHVDCD